MYSSTVFTENFSLTAFLEKIYGNHILWETSKRLAAIFYRNESLNKTHWVILSFFEVIAGIVSLSSSHDIYVIFSTYTWFKLSAWGPDKSLSLKYSNLTRIFLDIIHSEAFFSVTSVALQIIDSIILLFPEVFLKLFCLFHYFSYLLWDMHINITSKLLSLFAYFNFILQFSVLPCLTYPYNINSPLHCLQIGFHFSNSFILFLFLFSAAFNFFCCFVTYPPKNYLYCKLSQRWLLH